MTYGELAQLQVLLTKYGESLCDASDRTFEQIKARAEEITTANIEAGEDARPCPAEHAAYCLLLWASLEICLGAARPVEAPS